jgi:hypothetical protein
LTAYPLAALLTVRAHREEAAAKEVRAAKGRLDSALADEARA